MSWACGRNLRLVLCALSPGLILAVVAAEVIAQAQVPALPPAPPAESARGPATRVVRRRVVVMPATHPATTSIPGVVAQRDLRKKIQEIYAADYADTSFAGRRALAKRLIGASEETKRDSDAKFSLLREARDVSAAGGDVTTAFEVIDRMQAAAFPVSRLTERIEVMQMAVPVLTAPQANLAAVSICMDLADQCVVEGDYDRADGQI